MLHPEPSGVCGLKNSKARVPSFGWVHRLHWGEGEAGKGVIIYIWGVERHEHTA